MTIIGIISDTHLTACSEDFRLRINQVFAHCDAIIHAGDLTDLSVLDAFSGRDVYAVHGNMCNPKTSQILPGQLLFSLNGYTIGLCHGAGYQPNIEDRMLEIFPSADCIVFGHTHRPSCQYIGSTLLINPGSFQATSRYGAQGTFALLTIDDRGLHAALHEFPLPQ